MKSWAIACLLVSLAVVASCSSRSLEDAFTDSLEFGVPNTPVVGPLPEGHVRWAPGDAVAGQRAAHHDPGDKAIVRSPLAGRPHPVDQRGLRRFEVLLDSRATGREQLVGDDHRTCQARRVGV